MKKSILALCAVFAFSSVADERPEADPETIAELKQYCMEVAQEDGTGESTLAEFLLNCVNQELLDEGYKPIKKLD